MNPNMVRSVTSYSKPKIPAWGKPITPTVPIPAIKSDQIQPTKGSSKGPKYETNMIKPAYGTWQAPPPPKTTFKQVVENVGIKLRAILDQLAKFNPNTWGVSGSGTFQGLNAPTAGPSAQELINKAKGGR